MRRARLLLLALLGALALAIASGPGTAVAREEAVAGVRLPPPAGPPSTDPSARAETPVPTDTPEPTETPVPTETPEPDPPEPTETPLPAGA